VNPVAQTSITARRRAAVLLLGIAAVFLLLGIRLFYLQIIAGNRLQKEALDQRYRRIAVDPKRGAILDRNGRKLAISVHSDGVICNPREVTDPDAVAQLLGSILKTDAAEIRKLLDKDAMFVWIKRRITSEQADQIRQNLSRLPGISVTVRSERSYPKEMLAAHLLGIAGIDNQGLEGLEKYYDEILRGTPGSDMAEFDTGGLHIPGGEKTYTAPVDGSNIVLTIDEYLQAVSERELDKAIQDTGSKRGLIMIMDPRTGEILASAMRPAFDPANYNDYPAEYRRNFMLTDQYEPGSTFKVFTAAAAIEEGIVTPQSTFFDPGFIRVEDRNIHCWKAGGHGSQTFTEAVENSCNPVFATLSMKLGVDTFYRYLEAFGFGKVTGIDFPGEARGQLMSKKYVGPVEMANIGFGQGVSVTPLQMLTAVCAIANNGQLMQPYLVKEIQNPDGTVKSKTEPKVVRQVISEKTAATMRNLLESVVVNGSGNRAYLEGYRVAGKTGTAQKPKGGRYGEERVASFVGFAPADDPRIAMIVILDEPQTQIKYGGVLAGPVFGAVMKDALRYLQVLPRTTSEGQSDSNVKNVTVPNVLGNLGDAQATLAKNGLSWRLIGSGSVVTEQFPKPGATVKPGTQVLLYFSGHEKMEGKGYVEVPDLTGLGVSEVNARLKALGLILSASGGGTAYAQHPAAGTRLPVGARVQVNFRPQIND
jgi:stage V sporulation protein D (sporulation-specific penicillin-binding protein)